MDMALMPDVAYSMIKRTIGLKTAEKGYRDEASKVEIIPFEIEEFFILILDLVHHGCMTNQLHF